MNSAWNSAGLKPALRRACFVARLTSPKLKSSQAINRFPILPTGRTICSTWNKIIKAQATIVPFHGNYPPGSILERLGGQLPCFITYTTQKTAKLVRENIHKSPLYSGIIEGVGPRYCPSIEDKIIRFSDKERHQIFLEPEGIETDEIYVNGFSTSLPFEVQVELVRTIIGCENAEIMRPAYAVEYDLVLSDSTVTDLGDKDLSQLFLSRPD
jgi:glucose-inhibited division protein A